MFAFMWLRFNIFTGVWTSYRFVCSHSNQHIVTSIFIVWHLFYRFTMSVPSVHRSVQYQGARHWRTAIVPPMDVQLTAQQFPPIQPGATAGDASMNYGMPAQQMLHQVLMQCSPMLMLPPEVPFRAPLQPAQSASVLTVTSDCGYCIENIQTNLGWFLRYLLSSLISSMTQ